MSKEKLNPTLNSLPQKARSGAVAVLNATLANLSDFYSQAKQAHWNVRGKRFHSLHTLFDEVAESIEESIDEVAERAVQLGGYAEGTVRMAARASGLKEWPTDVSNSDEFVKALADRCATVANAVRDGIAVADKLGDADTADLLTGISRVLDKDLWMLEASQ